MKAKINKQNFLIGLPLISILLLSSCSQKKEEEKVTGPQIPTVLAAKVVRQKLDRNMDLTAELLAFQDVPIYAKVPGFIKLIRVDRGSMVKQGELMIKVFAPELEAECNEAESKVSAAKGSLLEAQSKLESSKADQLQAEAKLAADTLTAQRLTQAAKVPGTVALNEVDIAQKEVEGDKECVSSLHKLVLAAQSNLLAQKDRVKASEHQLRSVEDMRQYLTITAPFDGVVTERNVHEGSFVNTPDNSVALVRVQQRDHLRVVVAVPETVVGGVKLGQKVGFSVPAYPGVEFTGTIARPAYALLHKFRTEPVELDVWDYTHRLEPGMFATIHWHASRDYPTAFVPASAVTTSLENTFVVRIRNNKLDVVEVTRGQPMGDMIEVLGGNLQDGDLVAVTASEEMHTGADVITKLASNDEIQKAIHHKSAGGD